MEKYIKVKSKEANEKSILIHISFFTYTAESTTEKREVAIKIAGIQQESHLIKEANVYEVMKSTFGYPKVKCHGFEKGYYYLVMELLDISLEKYLSKYKCLSLKTVLMLADQMVKREGIFNV
jgi:hypothetical protein